MFIPIRLNVLLSISHDFVFPNIHGKRLIDSSIITYKEEAKIFGRKNHTKRFSRPPRTFMELIFLFWEE